jgi:CRP-like cAMP-binding protein
VNWKTDLKLADLDAAARIEIACRRCGLTRYELKDRLMALPEMQHAYLDQVENRLRCSDRRCKGRMRLSLVHDDKMEGFVGGMA